jgi:hypothetical protein
VAPQAGRRTADDPPARGQAALGLGRLAITWEDSWQVPLVGRWLAAVVGGLLVLTVWGSVIGTLIVPRPVGSWLTRWVDRLVNGAFGLAG